MHAFSLDPEYTRATFLHLLSNIGLRLQNYLIIHGIKAIVTLSLIVSNVHGVHVQYNKHEDDHVNEDDVHNDHDGGHDIHEVQPLSCDSAHGVPHIHHDNNFHVDCVLDVGDGGGGEHNENGGDDDEDDEDLRLSGVDGAGDACDLVPDDGCHDPHSHDKRPQCNKEIW